MYYADLRGPREPSSNPTQAYNAVATFSGAPGGQTAESWINSLEKAANFYRLTPDLKLQLALAKLTASAETWAASKEHALRDYVSFKAKFLERFGERK